ncbi:MAG: hypothetical protein A2014_03365 [Spirochaetes bacterium GWF1_49_6]|jgi:hypothetical protein|nr:MAG: hypothetical protein A2014_03365 [Spirochaetes bacterium GWF1_49_6]
MDLFKDIGLFILYFLPGFISTSFFNSKFPNKKKDNYQYLGYVLLHSIVTIFLTVLFYNLFKGNQFQDISYINKPPLEFIVTLFILSWFYGMLLRVFYNLKRILFSETHDRKKVIKLFRILFSYQDPLLIEIENRIKGKYWIFAKLENNIAYLGKLKKISYDPDDKDFELFLIEVRVVDHTGKTIMLDKKTPYPIQPGVYLPKKSIVSFELVEYKEEESSI